jgi:hypothetical protein
MRRTQPGPGDDPDDLNKIVQANIRKILGDRTPEAYCNERGRQLYYVSGRKRGSKVAPRALRYAVTEEQSPRLDLIAAIAAKEGIAPHQLLIATDRPPQARRWDDQVAAPLSS